MYKTGTRSRTRTSTRGCIHKAGGPRLSTPVLGLPPPLALHLLRHSLRRKRCRSRYETFPRIASRSCPRRLTPQPGPTVTITSSTTGRTSRATSTSPSGLARPASRSTSASASSAPRLVLCLTRSPTITSLRHVDAGWRWQRQLRPTRILRVSMGGSERSTGAALPRHCVRLDGTLSLRRPCRYVMMFKMTVSCSHDFYANKMTIL